MAVSSFDGQLNGDVFEDSPTVRLFLDDALVDDLDFVKPQRMPGMVVVRIESEDRQAWSSAAVVVLASVLLALAVVLALRLRNSHKHSAVRPVPRAAIARPLDRPASTSARHGSQRRARRRTRRPAHHRRVAIGRTRVPQRMHLVLPVVPAQVVDVPPHRPVPVPARHGEEFGFER
jgi:hypothetical protein